jgi:pyruvate dehydrogenase E2 component (dihydrolipoamide acetyltransferase)
MESGSIQAWHKAVGDSFTGGDVLCTIDTDKASVDFEAQDDGIIAKILVPGGTGEDIRIGVPMCVVVDDAELVPAFANFTATGSTSASVGVTSAVPEVAIAPLLAETSYRVPAPTALEPAGGRSLLMPSARYLAESKGLDAKMLRGSGKGGRVTKADVLRALETGSLPSIEARGDLKLAIAAAAELPPTPPPHLSSPSQNSVTVPSSAIRDLALPVIQTTGTFEDTPNSKMRKIIASRLTESKREVPHFYTSQQVQLDSIMKLRKKLANELDVKVSVNDFVLRCCALALRDVPEVNATIDPSTQQVRLLSGIDISVAVATPTGLITPIVFGADRLGLMEITETVKDLAARARLGKLAPHEYQGGSFSVSNLGMFGVDEFSAVINPPQAAILAVGGGSRRFIPTPYADAKSDLPSFTKTPAVRTLMTARLSADRRVVDEATASIFLSAFAYYANEPELMLL